MDDFTDSGNPHNGIKWVIGQGGVTLVAPDGWSVWLPNGHAGNSRRFTIFGGWYSARRTNTEGAQGDDGFDLMVNPALTLAIKLSVPVLDARPTKVGICLS